MEAMYQLKRTLLYSLVFLRQGALKNQRLIEYRQVIGSSYQTHPIGRSPSRMQNRFTLWRRAARRSPSSRDGNGDGGEGGGMARTGPPSLPVEDTVS